MCNQQQLILTRTAVNRNWVVSYFTRLLVYSDDAQTDLKSSPKIEELSPGAFACLYCSHLQYHSCPNGVINPLERLQLMATPIGVGFEGPTYD